MTNPQIVFAAIVLVGASARVTRLLAFDGYPPSAWLRSKWDALTEDSGWNKLLHCGYCLAPWVGLGLGAWGYLTEFQTAWWIFCSWMALAYAAAITVAYDGDE